VFASGYGVNESRDESSTNYIEQYYRPETESEEADNTSRSSDNESDADNCNNAYNDDVRPFWGTTSGSVLLDVEMSRRDDFEVAIVEDMCQTGVHDNISDYALSVVDLPPPLPLSRPPPLDYEEAEFPNSRSDCDAGLSGSTTSSFRLQPPPTVNEPEVHLRAACVTDARLRLPTIRNAGLSQFSSTLHSTGFVTRQYPTNPGCRNSVEPVGLYPHVNGGTSPVPNGETVVASDMDQCAMTTVETIANDVDRFQAATSAYGHQLPPPVDFDASSTDDDVCDDDGFQLATDDLPAPLLPSYSIDNKDVDDEWQLFEVDPPPPPPPLPSMPPPDFSVDLVHIER